MNSAVNIPFDNSYLRVADKLYSRQLPTPVKEPGLIRINRPLAELLGIDADALASPAGIEILAGNQLPAAADPVATAYAGHQFGGWNPQLGDGRAILLGEVVATDGCRYDIQLKGAGQTPYSRMGDGRSPLGPVLREYIVSEAMAALGVPTSRSLAAVTTGEHVFRDRVLPGAILTRVAQSHIRIGTFQYFDARDDHDTVRKLADHVIARHYPKVNDAGNRYLQLLKAAVARQAELIARWQALGFIHGVMNTDNMLISGETIDYGPCAFMDNFHPKTVFSSIDSGGRYAYQNQPAIAKWNLIWFAQALLPLIEDDGSKKAVELAGEAVETFTPQFQAAWERRFHAKLGFAELSPQTTELIEQLLVLMTEEKLDFTLCFRALADRLCATEVANPQSVAAIYSLPQSLDGWIERWRAALGNQGGAKVDFEEQCRERMYAVNPVFIPRNHLVEEAIAAATNNGDFQPFHQLVDLLAAPFDYNAEQSRYALPPRPEQVVLQTFCGT
ncbi:MAG: YdiU family protein [Porticoccaceae bacterium]